eukprot:TRINITY_DN1423_c0_g1_i3.p1 TRINITY_DN1423_c0_g1~~TRINITY_DN1423_c0_g1_i3.p1  ORF type:complete len:228 (+),score=31.74 TRINITY_DN1423_c0_g1_i3:216-899(+)
MGIISKMSGYPELPYGMSMSHQMIDPNVYEERDRYKKERDDLLEETKLLKSLLQDKEKKIGKLQDENHALRLVLELNHINLDYSKPRPQPYRMSEAKENPKEEKKDSEVENRVDNASRPAPALRPIVITESVSNMTYEQLLELENRIGKVEIGLDKKHFDRLTRMKYIKSKAIKSCPIDLQDFEEGEEIIILPCGHSFHEECLKGHFNTKKKCPVCLFDIELNLQYL